MGAGCVAAGGRRAIVKEVEGERERDRDGEMKSMRGERGEGGSCRPPAPEGG